MDSNPSQLTASSSSHPSSGPAAYTHSRSKTPVPGTLIVPGISPPQTRSRTRSRSPTPVPGSKHKMFSDQEKGGDSKKRSVTSRALAFAV